MRFTEYLLSRGLLYSPDGAGGGDAPTLSIEELTNQKLSGEDPSPPGVGEEPSGGGEPEGGQEPAGGEEPGSAEEPSGKEPATPKEPAGEEPATPSGDEAGEGGEEPGAEAGSGEEPEFYYDPDRDVEGRKPAHSNKFKTKENAEHAAIHKAVQVKETLDKMKEQGIDRGAIVLPGALNGDPAYLDNMTNLEVVASMDDKELKSWLDESDRFRQRLESKMEGKVNEQKSREAKNRFEKLQVDMYDNLKRVMPIEDLKANIDKFNDLEPGKEFLKLKINDKIKEGLAEDRQALEDWIDKVDKGDIELSFKEFDREKNQKVEAMAAKERELRTEYDPLFSQLEELYELSQDVEEQKQVSPEQKRENMFRSFDEFQTDRAGELAMLEDTPEARAELISFKQWALQNSADYNGLQTPADWNPASKGWEQFKKSVRAGRQKAELGGGKEPAGAKSGSKGSGDADIPKPGDQNQLNRDKGKSVHDVRRRSMDKLVELTNATIGT